MTMNDRASGRPGLVLKLGVATAGLAAALALSGCSESNPADLSTQTYVVDLSGAGDFTTIQDGLDAAADGDLILIEPGVYTGPGNRNLVFRGVSPTVSGTGARDEVVIDCEGSGRAFYIGSSSSPLIENLKITNGDTLRGGGIYLENSSPMIRNVRFVANHASYGGGGLFSRNGSPALEDVLFDDNTSGVEGGGLLCASSSPALTRVAFLRNAAGGSGGGVSCAFSSPAIAQCVFFNNSAGLGGAVYCGGSDPSISSCTIVDNEGAQGSGVYCGDGSEPSISHTIIALGYPGDALSCEGSDPFTTLSCVFDNGEENDLCGSHTTSMLYEDPLFCDLEAGDLTLRADSPCLPENNSWGVLIGALGEGCP